MMRLLVHLQSAHQPGCELRIACSFATHRFIVWYTRPLVVQRISNLTAEFLDLAIQYAVVIGIVYRHVDYVYAG